MKSSTLLLKMAVVTLMGVPNASLASEVRASVVSMAPGERAVRVEATWSQSPEVTWRYFATEDGLRCWAAPVIRLDLRIGEAAGFQEIAAAGFGQPGRHVAPPGDIGDLRGVLLYVVEGKQGKGTGLAGAVAGRTVLVNDGRDVPIEGDLRRRCRAKGRHRENRN